jgi:sec-independent protein translocase protein TatC
MVHSPFEGFSTWMRVAFMTGLLVSAPVVSFQAWAFVAPGLYKEERSAVAPLALSSSLLFAGGAAFCYYVMLPFAFPFFLQVLAVDVNLSVDGYLTSVIWMMVAFGACFQLPVISWFLARLGLVDHRDMIDGGRYAIVAIFIVAAILTPPDPISQIMLAVPMCLLYGVGIGVAWLTTTKVRDVPG